VNLKPICGKRTTSAETKNHAMKAMVKFKVVIVRVRHANAEPPFRQNISFSGSQRVSHVPSPMGGSIIFVILISLLMMQRVIQFTFDANGAAGE
jgi:hypothetical protein